MPHGFGSSPNEAKASCQKPPRTKLNWLNIRAFLEAHGVRTRKTTTWAIRKYGTSLIARRLSTVAKAAAAVTTIGSMMPVLFIAAAPTEAPAMISASFHGRRPSFITFQARTAPYATATNQKLSVDAATVRLARNAWAG